jgi:hypothetical protein
MEVEINRKITGEVITTITEAEDIKHICGTHYVIRSNAGRLYYVLGDDELMTVKYGR